MSENNEAQAGAVAASEAPAATPTAAVAPAIPEIRSAPMVSMRTALVLLVFTLAFTALMAGTYTLTKAPIAASAEAAKREVLAGVLPADAYDNDLLQDSQVLPAEAAFGQSAPFTVYRARKQGVPVALIAEIAAPDGYSGRIELIAAFAPNGDVLAARVTRHKETPGLGDYIDLAKDKQKDHPWITQFNGQGPAQVDEAQWRVKKDGGRFDQRAGATISARAVTNALGRAARHVALHANELLQEAKP